MGQDRLRRPSRAMAEKQEQFARLIAQGVSNAKVCRMVGSTGVPGHADSSGTRSAMWRTNRCTIRQCAPRARPSRGTQVPAVRGANIDRGSAPTGLDGAADHEGTRRALSTISRELARNASRPRKAIRDDV